MDPKTLELIQVTAQKAVQVYEISALSDAWKTFVFDGERVSEYAKEPPPSDHRVRTLDDLAKYALNVHNSLAEDQEETQVVWHDDRAVILILDYSDGRDKVTFPLVPSAKFVSMALLREEKPSLLQAEFIRMLRFTFGISGRIIDQFRRLQWETVATIQSQVIRGDNRLGKQVMEKVEGVDELPDEIDVPIPVYANDVDEPYCVRCGIEIDSRDHRFQLIPLPDELDRILRLAQASIRARLEVAFEGTNISVFNGTP